MHIYAYLLKISMTYNENRNEQHVYYGRMLLKVYTIHFLEMFLLVTKFSK